MRHYRIWISWIALFAIQLTITDYAFGMAASDDTQSKKDDVKLVVSGEGPNKEDAIKNALRSAIEQTYGVFVSSNTEILNDTLVKDEVATIASGNIKSYKELGSITKNDGQVSVTLEAIVSIGKLVSYVRGHGGSVEFAGQTFMMEMNMRKLNKANEIEAMRNLRKQLWDIQIYDYTLEIGTPKEETLIVKDIKGDRNVAGYRVRFNVKVKILDDNLAEAMRLYNATIKSMGLLPSDREQYDSTNTPYYWWPIMTTFRSARPDDLEGNVMDGWYFEYNSKVALRNKCSFYQDEFCREFVILLSGWRENGKSVPLSSCLLMTEDDRNSEYSPDVYFRIANKEISYRAEHVADSYYIRSYKNSFEELSEVVIPCLEVYNLGYSSTCYLDGIKPLREGYYTKNDNKFYIDVFLTEQQLSKLTGAKIAYLPYKHDPW